MLSRVETVEPGAIVAYDSGYTNYDRFASLEADDIYFVIRKKDNARYGVLEYRRVPERGPVQRDEIVFLYQYGGRDISQRLSAGPG